MSSQRRLLGILPHQSQATIRATVARVVKNTACTGNGQTEPVKVRSMPHWLWWILILLSFLPFVGCILLSVLGNQTGLGSEVGFYPMCDFMSEIVQQRHSNYLKDHPSPQNWGSFSLENNEGGHVSDTFYRTKTMFDVHLEPKSRTPTKHLGDICCCKIGNSHEVSSQTPSIEVVPVRIPIFESYIDSNMWTSYNVVSGRYRFCLTKYGASAWYSSSMSSNVPVKEVDKEVSQATHPEDDSRSQSQARVWNDRRDEWTPAPRCHPQERAPDAVETIQEEDPAPGTPRVQSQAKSVPGPQTPADEKAPEPPAEEVATGWNCAKCNTFNGCRLDECRHCGEKWDEGWYCGIRSCNRWNYSTRDVCFRCSEPRGAEQPSWSHTSTSYATGDWKDDDWKKEWSSNRFERSERKTGGQEERSPSYTYGGYRPTDGAPYQRVPNDQVPARVQPQARHSWDKDIHVTAPTQYNYYGQGQSVELYEKYLESQRDHQTQAIEMQDRYWKRQDLEVERRRTWETEDRDKVEKINAMSHDRAERMTMSIASMTLNTLQNTANITAKQSEDAMKAVVCVSANLAEAHKEVAKTVNETREDKYNFREASHFAMQRVAQAQALGDQGLSQASLLTIAGASSNPNMREAIRRLAETGGPDLSVHVKREFLRQSVSLLKANDKLCVSCSGINFSRNERCFRKPCNARIPTSWRTLVQDRLQALSRQCEDSGPQSQAEIRSTNHHLEVIIAQVDAELAHVAERSHYRRSDRRSDEPPRYEIRTETSRRDGSSGRPKRRRSPVEYQGYRSSYPRDRQSSYPQQDRPEREERRSRDERGGPSSSRAEPSQPQASRSELRWCRWCEQKSYQGGGVCLNRRCRRY